jgi:type IV pilus assembly protein PilE
VIEVVPANLKQSPTDTTATALDTLIIPTATASAFTLKMNPVTGGKMANDECGSFTLTSLGVRGVEDSGGTAGSTTLRDKCWK